MDGDSRLGYFLSSSLLLVVLLMLFFTCKFLPNDPTCSPIVGGQQPWGFGSLFHCPKKGSPTELPPVGFLDSNS